MHRYHKQRMDSMNACILLRYPLIFPLNEIYTLTYLTGERQGMPAISCQIHSGWKPMHQTPPPSKRICIVEEMKPLFKYFFSLALINTYHRLWCGKIIHAKFVFLVSTIFERIFSLSVFFQDVYALCKPERYLRWCGVEKPFFFLARGNNFCDRGK